MFKNCSVNSCWWSDFGFIGSVRKHVLARVALEEWTSRSNPQKCRNAGYLQGGEEVKKKFCSA